MVLAETFGEAAVAWGKILFILAPIWIPVVGTMIIVIIVKVIKHAFKLTSDIFKD